ncbi:MAG: glycosyltransferase family 2 protein [Leptospiraceae bacterium]|nr:glycosyltransferase family 2 protein [Leptospiraceae bacterium]
MEQANSTKLSVSIITFNEEKNIQDCIESVSEIADEILILDSFSKDRTKEIAIQNPKVRFLEHPFYGHVQQKNKAMEYCENEWVLSLDADERVDMILREAILDWKKQKSSEVIGFKISRLTWHLGRFIHHSGWYPLYRYRLFQKSKATWVGENPHDYIEIIGKGSKIAGNIIHFSFKDLSDQIETINKFSSIVAHTRFEKGNKFSLLSTLLKPIGKFWEIYIFKRGFLDGFPGFAIAASSAFSTFLKYAKIYELHHKIIQRPSNLRESYGEKKSK